MSKKRVTLQVDLVRLTMWMEKNKELVSGRDIPFVVEQALSSLSYKYPETAVRNVAEALGIGLYRKGVMNGDNFETDINNIKNELSAYRVANATLMERIDTMEGQIKDLQLHNNDLNKRLEPLLS